MSAGVALNFLSAVFQSSSVLLLRLRWIRSFPSAFSAHHQFSDSFRTSQTSKKKQLWLQASEDATHETEGLEEAEVSLSL